MFLWLVYVVVKQSIYYSVVTWASWHLKSLATWLFAQQLIHVKSKEKCHITALIYDAKPPVILDSPHVCGLGAFLRWWPPSNIWVGPLIFYGHHQGCLNKPIFLNLGLCAAWWAHFMCHHELWPASVSHPLSFSIVLYVLLEENITRKLLSLSLELFFKIVLFQVTFLILFSMAIFSSYFLLVGLLLQFVVLFQSGN